MEGWWPGGLRPGDLQAVAVAPLGGVDHAVVAAGVSGVHVFRLQAAGSPVGVGSLDTPGSAQAVSVHGSHAYVADGIGGLIVLDLSTPARPRRVGGYDSGGVTVGVSISGGVAWIADREQAVLALDLSNPAEPTLRLALPTTGQVLGVVATADRLYLTDSVEGLVVFSLPASGPPVRLGAWSRIQDWSEFAVAGNRVVLAEGAAGASILDFRFPASPIETGRWVSAGQVNGVATGGARFWLAEGAAGLSLLQVGANGIPVRTGRAETQGSALGVSEWGATGAVVLEETGGVGAYVTGGDGGLVVQGRAPLQGWARDVLGLGGLLYVADGPAGLRVLDGRSGEQPVEIGHLAGMPGANLQGLSLAGNLLLAAAGPGGLEVFDVSQPRNPVRVGGYREAWAKFDAQGVTASGNLALMTLASGELLILDLTRPDSPRRLGIARTGGVPGGVAVLGGMAYVAAGIEGLVSVDLHNPAFPVVVSRRAFPGRIRDVATDGARLFLAADHAGLQIVEPGGEDGLVRVGAVDTSGFASRVRVEGTLAYLAEGESGVRMVRISDLSRPLVVGGLDTDGFAAGLAMLDGRVAVADGSRVLLLGIPGVTPPVNSPPTFLARTNVVVLEDIGATAFPRWASSISPGPVTEAWQTVRFGPVTVDRPELFRSAPTVSPEGSLRFVTAPDASGVAVCRVWLADDGGRIGGGIDRSADHLFTIQILPVNDPPRVNPIPEVEWTAARLGTNLVISGLAPGPADESHQRLGLRVLSDTPEAIPSDPTIRYFTGATVANVFLRSSNTWSGRAWLRLIVTDDGGTERGGMDRIEIPFRVTVRPSAGAPFLTIDTPANGAVLDPGEPVIIQTTADAPGTEFARLDLLVDGVPVESRSSPGREESWVWTPAANGPRVLSLRGTDPLGRETLSSPVRVVVARRPRLSGGADLDLVEDTPSPPLRFTLEDTQWPAETLDLLFTAGNPGLLSPEGFHISGRGAIRDLVITPLPEASGSTWVEAILRNPDGLAATNRFEVRVAAVNDPPVVFLVEPRPGLDVPPGVPVTFQAIVADADGDPIRQVEFLVGDRVVGSAGWDPYAFQWVSDVDGEWELSARAFDGPGLSRQSAPIRVTLHRPPNLPPTLEVSAEGLEFDEDSAGGALRITLGDDRTAPQDLKAVARVLDQEPWVGLIRDSDLRFTGEGTNRVLQVSAIPDGFGEATVTLEVEDAEGGRTTRSIPIRVRPVNDLPEVSLVRPLPGDVLPAEVPVQVEAGARDAEGPPVLVELRLDGEVVAQWSEPPYRWDWMLPSPGSHRLVARVEDAEGAEAFSEGVAFEVSPPVRTNQPPVVEGGEPITVFQDGASLPVTLRAHDDTTPDAQLQWKVLSRDTELIRSEDLRLAGEGGSRSLVVAPSAGRSGSTVLDVVVRDLEGLTATLVLPVTVLGAAELPGGEPCFADTVPAGFGAFNVLRQGVYRQFVDVPEPAPVDGAASVELRAPPTYSVLTATVLGPGGARFDLSRREDGLFGWLESGSEAEVAARIPSGSWNTSFRLRLPNGDAFNGFFPFRLSPEVPPIPRITNLAEAGALPTSRDFILRWVPWTAAVTNDRVVLEIRDASGALVLSAASDCSGQIELGRRAEGIVIPAGRLSPGTSYTGQLTFAANQLAVNDRGPILMLRAFYSRSTRFSLRTASDQDPALGPALQVVRPPGPGIGLRLRVVGRTASLWNLEVSSDLRGWSVVAEVGLDASGAAEVDTPPASPGVVQFYRLAAPPR